jgi:hypothetical protein
MKKIVITIIAVVVICIAYFVYVVIEDGHSFNWKTCKQSTWIFKKSVTKDIDPNGRSLCSSYVKKNDIFNTFHYFHGRDMYPIFVWEFKDLRNVDLGKITINQNIDLSNIKISFGETFHANSSSPVSIKYGFSLRGGLSVNLDSFSKIDGAFHGPNYKGFYGTINTMSFNNKKGKPQIIFDYSDKPYKSSFSPTVFLLYKGHHSFYVIIINSEKPFKNANIINILNLK